MTTASPLKIRIDNVRIAFPRLYKGEQYQGAGNFRCGAQLIIPPDHPQAAAVDDLVEQAGKTKFKDKWPAARKTILAKDKLCLRDGDLKAKLEGFAGNKVLSANCRGGETEPECKKPKVYSSAATGRQLLTRDDGTIYSGCYVNALVEFYGDDRRGEQINCSLLGVQFHADGDAFAGSTAKDEDFEGAADGAGAGEFV